MSTGGGGIEKPGTGRATAASISGRFGQPREGFRLLLVEDDAATGALAAKYLRSRGFVVFGPVETEAAALHIAEAQRPDLVLADIELLDGDDGVTLAKELYRRRKIPTLLVSGSPQEAERARSVALGILTKPYEMSVLLRSVLFFRSWLKGTPEAVAPIEVALFPEAAPYREREAARRSRHP